MASITLPLNESVVAFAHPVDSGDHPGAIIAPGPGTLPTWTSGSPSVTAVPVASDASGLSATVTVLPSALPGAVQVTCSGQAPNSAGFQTSFTVNVQENNAVAFDFTFGTPFPAS